MPMPVSSTRYLAPDKDKCPQQFDRADCAGGLRHLGPLYHPIAMYFCTYSASFCISSHTVNFYFKLPNDCASVVYTFRLLFGKHLGSVVGGAFVNGLFFLPQAVLDLVRSCRNSKIKTNFCFFNAIDLARADAMSLIIISGTPYCNASKYCEYLWNESMTTDQTQSSIRVFKLAGHVFIANVGSLIGLLLRGDMDPYLLAFTQVVGLFISTFFIEFNAVSS